MICVTRRDSRGVTAQSGDIQGAAIVTVGTNASTAYLDPQSAYEYAIYTARLARRVANEHGIPIFEPAP